MKTLNSIIHGLLLLSILGCEQGLEVPHSNVAPSLSGHEEAITFEGPPLLSTNPEYTQLESASAEGNQGILHLGVDAGGSIPRHPDGFIQSVPVFGYAWVNTSDGRGIVTVIHPMIGRDSNQNPDGWHTHPVQLSEGADFDFCIESIGRSQGGITINGDKLNLNISMRWGGLNVPEITAAAAFIVQPDAGCVTTGLAVDLTDDPVVL